MPRGTVACFFVARLGTASGPRDSQKKMKRYRIRKHAAPLRAFCVDPKRGTVIHARDMTMLRQQIRERMEQLVTSVEYRPIAPVVWGGPGVRRQLLEEQMLRDARQV